MATSYASDPLEARSLMFFVERTITQFQTFFPDDFWNSHVLQFALSQDSIRHALISLAAHHERYLRPDTPHAPSTKTMAAFALPFLPPEQRAAAHAQAIADSPPPDDVPTDTAFALKQHNLAITALLAGGDPSKSIHVHLVSCLIFICIQALQGELLSAINLFKHGLGLIKALYRQQNDAEAIGATLGAPPSAGSTGIESIASAVVAFLSRFAVQVALLAGDMDPQISMTYLSGISKRPTLSPVTKFHSLVDARESILNLAILILSNYSRTAEGRSYGTTRLEWWTQAYDALVADQGDKLPKRGIALLELHCTYLHTHLKVPDVVAGENMLDCLTDEYSNIVTLAEQVVKLQGGKIERNPRSAVPEFHMDLGVIPVMFSIVLRCRDQTVRRRALNVLRNNRLQEGIWDSSLTLQASERIVMLEESSIAAGAQLSPSRVTSVQVVLDAEQKEATLQYGLEGHTFEEVLNW
ncbi:c6 zinc finger domain protein [Ophiostoma piceae UAMH 11346]|uniref:C6 zinc finger domain protein n=1 Tax=Ophiostoma piceae (strain UAMH 11346) TaxID=1262450 RepID=S3BV64_OPHP1|nr:c6 zinc finger domain protein [Ophiostoma piceae UAMH 11346]